MIMIKWFKLIPYDPFSVLVLIVVMITTMTWILTESSECPVAQQSFIKRCQVTEQDRGLIEKKLSKESDSERGSYIKASNFLFLDHID